MKPYHEMSLLEFQNRFPDEGVCWDYLVKMRWPKGYRCPNCPEAKVYLKRSTQHFACAQCHRQTSVTAGTIFHKSRMPLQKWFWAIFLMATSSKGVSMRNLQKHLRIKSYRTVWLMGHKIRQAMLAREGIYKLKGKVQVDEFSLGSQNWDNRRKIREDRRTRFLIGAQEGAAKDYPRFVTFEELAASFKENILPAIEKRIAKGSKLKTDAAGAFKAAEEKGYKVDQISFSGEPKKAKKHLGGVYWVHSNMKRGLVSTYHGCFPKYRKAYLAEFAYRFNRRYWPHQAFDRLLFACLHGPKTTLRQLRA